MKMMYIGKWLMNIWDEEYGYDDNGDDIDYDDGELVADNPGTYYDVDDY